MWVQFGIGDLLAMPLKDADTCCCLLSLLLSASLQHWKHLPSEPRGLCSWFVVCKYLHEDVPAWVVFFPSLILSRQCRISASNNATNVSFHVLHAASFTNIPGTGTLALLLQASPQPNVFWLGGLFLAFLYNKIAKYFSSCNCIFFPTLVYGRRWVNLQCKLPVIKLCSSEMYLNTLFLWKKNVFTKFYFILHPKPRQYRFPQNTP